MDPEETGPCGEEREARRKRRRPATMNSRHLEVIIRRISSGESLRAICEPETMPCHVTVLRQVLADSGLCKRYERAQEIRAEMLIDEIRAIIEHGRNDWMKRNHPDTPGYSSLGEAVQRSRLRIEIRRWVMETRSPRRYGRGVQRETEEMISVSLVRNALDLGKCRPLPVRPSMPGRP